jgi:hemerythrin
MFIVGRKKTELVKWSPTFSVRIKVIDDQHKELLKLVNDLFNHAGSDKATERAYFAKVIQKAVWYIKVHFGTEEKIMNYTNFSGYAEHKKAHDSFLLAVINTAKNFEAGNKFTQVEFTRFLKDWILTHIAIMDKQDFTCLKQIASLKADGKPGIKQSDIAARQ